MNLGLNTKTLNPEKKEKVNSFRKNIKLPLPNKKRKKYASINYY